MTDQSIPVKFEPHNITIHVAHGVTIREAALEAGIALDAPCGGQGTCGKCRVRILDHSVPVNEADQVAFNEKELEHGFRLACQATVEVPVTVEIPRSSLLNADYQVLTTTQATQFDSAVPPVRKHYLELNSPTLEDDVSDVSRLERAVGALEMDLSMLQALPQRLRAGGFLGTAVVADDRLVDFESGDTTASNHAVAFDVGTTTIVGVLLDVTSGAQCAVASRMNPQILYGDDVLSRILHARENAHGLRQLQEDVVEAIAGIIEELAAEAGVDPATIYQATFSGNTTMQQLLAGIDPSPLGEVPFVSACGRALRIPAAMLGLCIHPRAEAFIFPVIGGFVGGDTVSGILVTGITQATGPMLLVDIGTNGEIVLCHEGKLEAASTAAGPAFEGARIVHGMRAAAGAIEKVEVGDDVEYSVIGDAKPVGICGSALIDIVAGLLRHGIVGPEGMMLGPDGLPEDLPARLRERVVEGNDGPEFIVAGAGESGKDTGICVSHRDIRELQLATAAIRAGVAILLRRAGIGPADLDRFLVAGAFGNYLRQENAQRIGLLPPDLDPARFAFVGNSSLAGAQRAALSMPARGEADRLARRVTHVDLSLDLNFQTEYVEAMMFPFE